MKSNDLAIIALYLDKEDSSFHSLKTGGESVTGLFEYVEERRPYGEDDVMGEIPFSIDLHDIVWAAQRLNFITEFKNGRKGLAIWEVGSFDDDIATPAGDWLVYMGEFHNPAMQEILTEAFRCLFTAHVEGLAVEIAAGAASCSIVERIRRDVDTAFCDAVEALAEIIHTVNGDADSASLRLPGRYSLRMTANERIEEVWEEADLFSRLRMDWIEPEKRNL